MSSLAFSLRQGSPTVRRVALACVMIIVSCAGGCATDRWARLRSHPFNPLVHQLELDSHKGPQPTSRTMQMLRRNNLSEDLDKSPSALVAKVQDIAYREPSSDNVYSIAEVAYIGAKRLEEKGETKLALDLYATAAANAYFYLFDRSFELGRNPYDPRFRRACDLYNTSLESTLRFMHQLDLLKPGGVLTIENGEQTFDFQIATRGTWHEDNFCELKFVSDFQVETLKNIYRTFGLGVPLIAVYANQNDCAVDRFYPEGMSFPVTAFMRIVDSKSTAVEDSTIRHRCVIELHDPMVDLEIPVGEQRVPLETDLTTPLAYSLDNPTFRQANEAFQVLRKSDQTLAVSGLYMLEPYDARKIPVVMVHGFWSSLVTWMEMFNDLRGSTEIRDHYQFWFYLYPTGVPPWFSATHLRQELADARGTLDPYRQNVALDQMVVVGHSMGGLIAKLLAQDSHDDFWNLVSPQPLSELVACEEDRNKLQSAFYFKANPSLRRIVTIATPFQGSRFSNGTTQWLSRQVIKLPNMLVDTQKKLFKDNPGFFPENSLVRYETSVSALAPNSTLLQVIDKQPVAPWVKHHNIIGVLDKQPWLRAGAESDGIVQASSARAPGAVSEISVPSDHVNVHRHPLAILEVRRILLEHLNELRANASPPQTWGQLSLAK